VPDLGAPSSYLVLAEGTPVYASGGEELGKVEHVLAEPEVDVFDGLVIDPAGLGRDHRFVDAAQIQQVYERGVLLTLSADAAAGLPEPSANPAEIAAGPEDTVPDDLGDKLRRAWDRISGNY
jgi:uncharacterized protein YrrD